MKLLRTRDYIFVVYIFVNMKAILQNDYY